MAVGVLGEGSVAVLAVDLGRAGDQDLAPVAMGSLDDDLRAADVGGEGPKRLFDDEAYPDGGGQVDDDLGFVHELVDHELVEDGALHQAEVGIAPDVVEVAQAAGGEVVE